MENYYIQMVKKTLQGNQMEKRMMGIKESCKALGKYVMQENNQDRNIE